MAIVVDGQRHDSPHRRDSGSPASLDGKLQGNKERVCALPFLSLGAKEPDIVSWEPRWPPGCKATNILWSPLRRWMGYVHIRLRDLQTWEKRDPGRWNVEQRIRAVYREACAKVSHRWRHLISLSLSLSLSLSS